MAFELSFLASLYSFLWRLPHPVAKMSLESEDRWGQSFLLDTLCLPRQHPLPQFAPPTLLPVRLCLLFFLPPIFAALLRSKPSYTCVYWFLGERGFIELAGAFSVSGSGLPSYCSFSGYPCAWPVWSTLILALASKCQAGSSGWFSRSEQGPCAAIHLCLHCLAWSLAHRHLMVISSVNKWIKNCS